MSKVLPATCAAGVVTAGLPPLPVPTAVIQSAGIGPSTGVVIIDELDAYYVPNASSNLETTIQKLIDVLVQVKTALDKTVSSLTAIDTHVPLAVATTGTAAAQTGTAVWVPVATADIPQITAAATAIDLIRVELVTLKGSLI